MMQIQFEKVKARPVLTADAIAQELRPIVDRWRLSLTSTLRPAIYEKYNRRTGRLGSSVDVSGVTITPTGEESAQVEVDITGGTDYAATQEQGRDDLVRQDKGGLFMVPVFSKFGNRPVSKEQMRAELSTGRVVLLPGERRISSASGRSKWVPQSQWRNWLKDAAGRKYKAFVRFPEYQKKSKLIKRKKGRIGLSARRPGREAGELLFLGYKDIIPGIPGRATGGKFTAKTSKSPLVSKYGMEAPRKGRGAISQHIAENMPRLTEELWNQRVLDRLAERALSVLVKEVSK